MNYWATEVYGDTLYNLRERAEAEVIEFFGHLREYDLDVRPHESSGFRNVGDQAPKWEAIVRVEFE